MRFCFVTDKSVNNVWQNQLNGFNGNDLILFGFNGLGLVSYKKELSGETEYFQDVAKLSKLLNTTLISGVDTDTYGVFKHSAVIADRGKLLGVSDMVHQIEDSEFSSGGNFRVYDTKCGKIGVIVYDDLLFPESSRVLTLCDADFIVCVYKRVTDYIPQLMVRANSYTNGIPVLFCAENGFYVSNAKGEIEYQGKGSSNIFFGNISIDKDYKLITSRRRGLYKDFNSGY